MNKIITKFDYDLKNFYYDDIIKFKENQSKIKVYRTGESFKYNRIIIKTPRMRLAFDPKKNKYNSISLSLHPLTENIKKFYNFIKKIDKLNKQHVRNIFSKNKMIYKSNIIKNKDTNFRYIQFNLSNKCTIFNWKKENCTKSDLLFENDVTFLIELNYIWMNDKKYGTNWDILQIKMHRPILNLDDCLFISDSDTDDENSEVKTIYKCLNCNRNYDNKPVLENLYNKPMQKQIPQPPLPPKKSTNTERKIISFRPPSVKDILNMKNKLKKTVS